VATLLDRFEEQKMKKTKGKPCTICGEPIVLVPSAAERARKDVTGKPAQYFINLFDQHSECTVKKRSEEAVANMRRYRETGEGMII